ncbi:FtsX-like permease family protein [Synechococcus sp. UW140]|uniref:FtsX-like permease family protein n=1 Tax=Synechococcus sp. UW140 TaxID=368503 RepID=UPI00313774B8
MKFSKRLPLAIKQLKDSPIKTAAATAGICFSNVLVFFQLGLLESIYQSQSRPYSLLDGEIVIVSSRFKRLSQSPTISISEIMRAKGVEGVAKVSTLSIELGTVLIKSEGMTTNAQIYGIDPLNSALDTEKIGLDLKLVDLYERAAIDTLSRPSYVRDAKREMIQKNSYRTNLIDKRILINSTAKIGSTFASDMSLVMSQNNLLHYYPKRNQHIANLGVVKISKNYAKERVKKALSEKLFPNGGTVSAMLIEEISKTEMNYWSKNTALTFIFGLGVIVGFVVSGIILYQILYSDVISHLPEYATLLALGYTNIFVIKIVFTQALILTLMSFPFSILISMGLYSIMMSASNLLIYMTIGRAIIVASLSIATSMISCYIATNKLREVDPSTLY